MGNHKQTHKQEIEGGYLWSSKTKSDGSRNLPRTAPNEIVPILHISMNSSAVAACAGFCCGGSNLFDGFLVGSLWLDVNEAKGISS